MPVEYARSNDGNTKCRIGRQHYLSKNDHAPASCYSMVVYALGVRINANAE